MYTNIALAINDESITNLVCTNRSVWSYIVLMGTRKRRTATVSSTSGMNATSKRRRNQLVRDLVTVNAQQRNDIDECPLTQSDIH